MRGDASRYGKSQSTENANEVLSDALKEALAVLFDQKSIGLKGKDDGGAVNGGGGTITASNLLVQLRQLKDQGAAETLMLAFVGQHHLSQPMTAGDIANWKSAGMSETVILAGINSVRR